MANCCVKYPHEASKTTSGVPKNIEERINGKIIY